MLRPLNASVAAAAEDSHAVMMTEIVEALASDGPIPQTLLSELGKSALRKYLSVQSGGAEINEAQKLWEKLLVTALSPSVSDKHLTTACNAIAVFMLNASSSPLPEIQSFAFSAKLWFESYECVQRAFKDGKTKPALQVLETLTQLLRENMDRQVALNILRKTAMSLIEVIIIGDRQFRAKDACVSFSCLLRRTTIMSELEMVSSACIDQRLVSQRWRHRQAQNNIQPEDRSKDRPGVAQFLLALLFTMKSLETRTAALKLFLQICHHVETPKNCRSLGELAAEVIELYIQRNYSLLGDLSDNVLPVVLDDQNRYQAFAQLYAPQSYKDDRKLILFLAVLKIGRLKKFVPENDLPNILNSAFTGVTPGLSTCADPYLVFRSLLQSSSSSVRLHAYSLLVASFATNAKVSVGILDCFLATVRYLHDDNDAHLRGEILSVTRKLVKRIENSEHSLRISAGLDDPDDAVSDTLASYKLFSSKLLAFLQGELAPGVSYQRHILALHTLQLALGMCIKCEPLSVTSSLFKSLSSLILDPYEDVRNLATILCKNLARSNPVIAMHVLDKRCIDAVTTVSARTGRSDHTDAAGRLWAISTPVLWEQRASVSDCPQHYGASEPWLPIARKLEQHLTGSTSLSPSSSFPLHGLLLGVAHYLNSQDTEAKQLSNTDMKPLISICQNVWRLVQSDLCVDSPETSSNEAEEDGLSGPKDLLAYSWRALRDSSLLLQSMLGVACEEEETFQTIGALCIEQLTMLRHRGAFSTVAQTFSLCCDRVRLAVNQTINGFIHYWYTVSLLQIDKQSRKLTRRSAGLPAIFAGILSPTNAKLFVNALTTLTRIASEVVERHAERETEPSLPQVHAMNCLKDIMTNSKFRAISEEYVGQMLQLAANSLSSKTWAIRNCGLMLLRACMNRLDQDSAEAIVLLDPSSRVGFSRKQPLEVALGILQDSVPRLETSNQVTAIPDRDQSSSNALSSMDSENIFVALDLLRHIRASPQDTDWIRQLVQYQLRNPIWAVRDHAARVLAASSSVTDMLNFSMASLVLSSAATFGNEVHGHLLCCRYVLQRCWEESESEEIFERFEALVHHLKPYLGISSSPVVRAAALDIFNDAFSYSLNNVDVYRDLAMLLGNSPVNFGQDDFKQNYHISSRVLLYSVNVYLTQLQNHIFTTVKVPNRLLGPLLDRPDEARYVIESLMHIRDNFHAMAIIDFLCTMICANSIEDIRALSMSALSIWLEGSDPEVSLLFEQKELLHRSLAQRESCGRELKDATLRLEAFLLRESLHQDSGPTPAALMRRLSVWALAIQAASADELELLTRFNAAKSMTICAYSILAMDNQESKKPLMRIQLTLLDVLYNQLNDDDEDVRALAVQAASKVLNKIENTSTSATNFCPLAAREALLSMISNRFYSSSLLATLAMTKIVDPVKGRLFFSGESCNGLFRISVSKSLRRIAATMSDLFAEERQNLYIDEIDEIQKWSSMLRRCTIRKVPVEVLSIARDWALQGLDELYRTLQHDDPIRISLSLASPFGVTYNFEVLVVFVKVIMLAGALCQMDRGNLSWGHDKNFELLTQLEPKLKLFESACEETDIHPRVKQALREALAEA